MRDRASEELGQLAREAGRRRAEPQAGGGLGRQRGERRRGLPELRQLAPMLRLAVAVPAVAVKEEDDARTRLAERAQPLRERRGLALRRHGHQDEVAPRQLAVDVRVEHRREVAHAVREGEVGAEDRVVQHGAGRGERRAHLGLGLAVDEDDRREPACGGLAHQPERLVEAMPGASGEAMVDGHQPRGRGGKRGPLGPLPFVEGVDARIDAWVAGAEQEAVRVDAAVVVEDDRLRGQELGCPRELRHVDREIQRRGRLPVRDGARRDRERQGRLVRVVLAWREESRLVQQAAVVIPPSRGEVSRQRRRDRQHAGVEVGDRRFRQERRHVAPRRERQAEVGEQANKDVVRHGRHVRDGGREDASRQERQRVADEERVAVEQQEARRAGRLGLGEELQLVGERAPRVEPRHDADLGPERRERRARLRPDALDGADEDPRRRRASTEPADGTHQP